jgi:hypothetical protein
MVDNIVATTLVDICCELIIKTVSFQHHTVQKLIKTISKLFEINNQIEFISNFEAIICESLVSFMKRVAFFATDFKSLFIHSFRIRFVVISFSYFLLFFLERQIAFEILGLFFKE